MYLCVKKYKQRSSKIPVIPTIHNGANITHCVLSEQLYLYICRYVCKHKPCYNEQCSTGLTWAENQSDMDCE